MPHARSSLVRMSSGPLPLLLAGLLTMLPMAVHAQDAPPPPAENGEEGPGQEEEKKDAEAEAVDPRIKAQKEKARRLRIERQTEIVSNLPTEGGLLSPLNVPDGLIGQRGLRYGRFVLLPALSFGASYTDNADADDENREEDLSLDATGAVRAQSILARHEIGVDAIAQTSHSFQEENDDYFDWQIGGDARLDLTRKSSVFGRLDYSLDTEDDSSLEAEDEANDIETINGTLGYSFRGNRIDYLIDVAADRSEFSGTDSADRDNMTYRISNRLSHRTTERLTLFVAPQYAFTAFDEDVADDGEGRDAQIATGLVGADLVFRSPITLSGAVGYTRLFFDDPDQDDTDSLVANGSLSWTASPLTSLELSASHALALTTVDDSAARTDTSLELGVSRQIGLDTALSSQVAATYADFRNVDRSDIDISASAGLVHRLNKNFFLNLVYQYRQRFSDEDVDFYENQAVLGFSVIY